MMTRLALCSCVLALTASMALAQQSAPTTPPSGTPGAPAPAPPTAPGTPAPAPSAAQPSPSTTTSAPSPSGASGNVIARQSPGQMLASQYRGSDVYGPNNERVGDVKDLVLDRSGNAMAVVLGVGGFLGIGEKDVAVPFASVQMTERDGANRLTVNVTREQLDAAPTFQSQSR